MFFKRSNIRQVPWEVLKTAAFGLGFQYLPRDLANVNAWKPMFDPCSMLGKNKSADDIILLYYSYLSQEIGFDIS